MLGGGGGSLKRKAIPDGVCIYKVQVCSGWYVDGIKFFGYEKDDPTSEWESPFLGSRNGKCKTWPLDGCLVDLKGNYGRIVDQLGFVVEKDHVNMVGGRWEAV